VELELSPFELNKPDYLLLWGCFRSSSASSSTPAGCVLQLIHGLDGDEDEGARGAKPQSDGFSIQDPGPEGGGPTFET
jgi:hypothetical protein